MLLEAMFWVIWISAIDGPSLEVDPPGLPVSPQLHHPLVFGLQMLVDGLEVSLSESGDRCQTVLALILRGKAT